MTEAELQHLIEPHLKHILETTIANLYTPLTCAEGAPDTCDNAVLNWSTDDIVLLHDIDDNQLIFTASHRACAQLAWGADHLIPAHRYNPSPTHAAWRNE